MSPEEFDNRLRSTFKDEYLPPREHLWQNINTRLEQPQGIGTNWHWLAPVVITVIAGIAWLTYSNVKQTKSDNSYVVAETTVTNPNSVDASAPASSENNTKNPATPNETGVKNNNNSASASIADNKGKSNTSAESYTKNQSGQKTSGSDDQSRNIGFNAQSVNRTGGSDAHFSNTGDNSDIANNHNQSSGNGGNSNSGANSTYTDNTVSSSNNTGNNSQVEEDIFSNLKLSFFKKFGFNFHLEANDAIRLSFTKRPEVKPAAMDKVYYAGNFENNKHWINFGIGAIRAYNSFDGYIDPTYTVHKDLWSKRDKLTNRGAGFNAFLTYQSKFAFKGRLSYETGFNFTSRSEDIKLNEYSRDIAYRSGDTIKQYQQVDLWTIAPGGDTNWYNLETPFVLVSKNRYYVVTIPIKLNYEQPISKHSFVAFGVGGGVSFISTRKSKHLDLVHENEFDAKYTNQVKASFNSMVSLYTNFNSLGQLGIYCGYQMYIGSFKLNDQYGIKMSDLQYGFTFRRPLNL
jgi:hypothetical protein